MPAKKYSAIICDPPWTYKNSGNGRARAHYDTMPLDQIAALPVAELAAPDSVLLMWATWPQLAGAVDVGRGWGFEFVTGLPWVKLAKVDPLVDLFGNPAPLRPVFGTGAWVRGATEAILIFRRGRPRLPDIPFVGLIGPRWQHSRKPDSVHELAEAMAGPYLEMFARRPRPGWDVWGNEIESSPAAVAVLGQPDPVAGADRPVAWSWDDTVDPPAWHGDPGVER